MDPDNYDANLMAGSIYGEMGQLTQSVKHLTIAHELRPSDPASGLTLAHVLRAQDNTSLAIACLQRTVQAGASDPDIFILLGALQMETGQFA